MKTIKEAKLYPNKTQEKYLSELLDNSRLLYNDILELRIKLFKEEGKVITAYDADKLFNSYEIKMPNSLRMTVSKRVYRAFQKFLSKKSGFPRFRSKNRYRSFSIHRYMKDYQIVEDKLRIWGKTGLIKLRGLQKLNKPSGATIIKRSSGWYIQIYDEPELTIKPKKSAIGIDLGLKYFLADSKGNTVDAPKVLREKERSLRIENRRLKNKVKFSNRWFKQAKSISRLYENVVNKRKDWIHKLSRSYANKYGIVYAEKLNVKGMVRNHHLSKSIHDASWGLFLRKLDYKLEMLGRGLRLVSPRFTSQKCSACGDMVKKSLSVRTHDCPNCGFISDRDVNAALNILRLGQSLQALT